MQRISITREQARRFLISEFGLDGFQTESSVSEAIDRLGFVQEDSINICGRMHDLILWQRVKHYTPERLADALYGKDPAATAFEFHFPNLCVLSQSIYPYFVGRMQARKNSDSHYWGALSSEERDIADKLLAKIDSDGAIRTRSAGNEDGHTVSGWGMKATVISRVAEKLWAQGVLAIARRENFERYFDRIERVYPRLAPWHSSAASLPDAIETERFLVRQRLFAKRLFRRRAAHRSASLWRGKALVHAHGVGPEAHAGAKCGGESDTATRPARSIGL
jgi:uncharacterized protein